MGRREWKIVAATITIFGTVFNLLGRFYGSGKLVDYPVYWWADMVDSIGWYLILVAPIIYIVLDWPSLSKPKDNKD